MPKAALKALEPIQVYSILEPDGSVDSELEPDLPDDKLQAMYRAMLLARRFDERLLNLQRQGRLGTFAPVTGQEAAQIGSIAAVDQDDWMAPSFRETAAAVWRGTPLDGLFIFIAGYNEGQAIPEDQNDLPICVPVGSQLPHAVGMAYALKVKRSDRLVITYFGDGATSEGDFHEALNFAGVFETPTIFMCQNNQWAISVPREKQTRAQSLAQKAAAYGFPGVKVDGNDVLAVYRATSEAVQRAREESLPTLIECETYRMGVHTTADDPTVYRDEEEVEEWRERDPLDRFRKYLKSRDLLSDDHHETLEEEVKNEIEEAWQSAQDQIEGFDDPTVIFDHMFQDPTKPIADQREAFEQAAKKEKTNG
ncbi:MAG TPA: pyruvate dehydrogenase (acetyl-transferring) E1 component subunit alpha [Alphaproteobacteria bacterium]|nr:pyruvate dehydrogenase (acetyl-transferring) E1 component subunit alpha [Alphaproteobacteria bacterium]